MLICFNLIHLLSNTQKLEFQINKKLIYRSFTDLVAETPYVDPYYQNRLLKKMNMSFVYDKKITTNIAFNSSLRYVRLQGAFIPFLFVDRDDYIIGTQHINSLEFYSDRIQNGIALSSSFNVDYEKINFLLQLDYNNIKSQDHNNKQFNPRFKFSTLLEYDLTNQINFISN